jgi:hypothetical protein
MGIALLKMALVAAPAVAWAAGAGGCRSAVVVDSNDPKTQTVVTVERRPTTSAADKHLIVRDLGATSRPAISTSP